MILTIEHKMQVIQSEIDILRDRIQEHDTGHIHTTIGVLNQRLEEMNKERLQQQQQRNK